MSITIEEAQKDKSLLDQFIIDNQKLVTHTIWKYFNFAHKAGTFDDYFQIGCVGLIKAAKRFDTKFNTAFSTYAVPMIVGEIRRHRRDHGTSIIKMPRSAQDTYYKYTTMRESQKSDEEICKELNISPEALAGIVKTIEGMISLSQTIGNDPDGHSYETIIADELDLEETVLNKIEHQELIEIARKTLSERDFKILMLHISGKKQTDIALMIGMAQANVSRRLIAIQKKCKKAINFQEKCTNLNKTKEEKTTMAEMKNKETAERLLGEGKGLEEIAEIMGYPHLKYAKASMVRWGLIDGHKKEQGKQVVTEVAAHQEEQPKQENKINLLRPRVLVGEDAEYEVLNDGLIIRDLGARGNQLVISLVSLDRFISELQELKLLNRMGE